jgi:hypothetical protein
MGARELEIHHEVYQIPVRIGWLPVFEGFHFEMIGIGGDNHLKLHIVMNERRPAYHFHMVPPSLSMIITLQHEHREFIQRNAFEYAKPL